jgi:hypothetical protein
MDDVMGHSADSRDSSSSAGEVDTITLRIINGMVLVPISLALFLFEF